jgi:hypothetical protein
MDPTHATWHSPTDPHQQPLHQTGTNGSTWLSHVDKGRPRGIHLFVHISNYSTRQRHMAASGWATSTTRDHVAPSYWSTSASGPHPSTSHLTGGPHLSATWQSFNGPPHPTLCHMAASQATTSLGICHVAAHYIATSPFGLQLLDTWQQAIGPRQHMWAPLCAMCHSQDSAQSARLTAITG